MRKLTYLAVLEENDNGEYGVYFPDLPGCISFGKDFEEAQKMGKEALELHIYGMEKDKEEIPNPTKSPHYLNINPETNKGYIITPIAIFPDLVKNEMDNRSVKTNCTIPLWLKEAAEEKDVNFSHLLQNALKEYLDV